MNPSWYSNWFDRVARGAAAWGVSLALAGAVLPVQAADVQPLRESYLDAIFSQPGFGSQTIDIRFNPTQTIYGEDWLVIDVDKGFPDDGPGSIWGLTQAGGLAIPNIRRAFGTDAILPDGSMNRDHMRALVFKDPKQRIILEKILHPKIREVVQQRLEQGAQHYFLIVVPLLFEKGGWGELMDEVIVVDCPVDQQVARVIQRNGWPETQVRAVIGNQADRKVRLAGADHIIENTGDLPELIEKIDEQNARPERHQKPEDQHVPQQLQGFFPVGMTT